ncbi:hypothetical protein EDC01DRAFT_672077 [Geopyxis carbonaria]|nr:hypothetical protein EDC01DRAFT_672077 [Geopyxis carbonaria]
MEGKALELGTDGVLCTCVWFSLCMDVSATCLQCMILVSLGYNYTKVDNTSLLPFPPRPPLSLPNLPVPTLLPVKSRYFPPFPRFPGFTSTSFPLKTRSSLGCISPGCISPGCICVGVGVSGVVVGVVVGVVLVGGSVGSVGVGGVGGGDGATRRVLGALNGVGGRPRVGANSDLRGGDGDGVDGVEGFIVVVSCGVVQTCWRAGGLADWWGTLASKVCGFSVQVVTPGGYFRPSVCSGYSVYSYSLVYSVGGYLCGVQTQHVTFSGAGCLRLRRRGGGGVVRVIPGDG